MLHVLQEIGLGILCEDFRILHRGWNVEAWEMLWVVSFEGTYIVSILYPTNAPSQEEPIIRPQLWRVLAELLMMQGVVSGGQEI
jgi:hypothetical protein